MINVQLRLLHCSESGDVAKASKHADANANSEACYGTPPSPHAVLPTPLRKPRRNRSGKRERLQVSQAVLKLALKLLRELESPNQISGLSMNPIFYNAVKIVVVSALSAALSEALGFDLKVWKIVKLK